MELLAKSNLRVYSAVFSNLAVVWVVASLAATNISTLLRDVTLVIVFVGLATKAERLIEEL